MNAAAAIVEPEVSLSSIHVPSGFNARAKRNAAKFAQLKDSIQAQGLLQPVSVLPQADGKLFLVAGFRRFAAMSELGRKTIKVTVSQAQTVEDALLVNLAENVGREELDAYSLASRLHMLADTYKMPTERIALDAGVSLSHAENLLRIMRKVDASILAKWAKAPDVISLKFLLSIAPLPFAYQKADFEKMYGSKEAPEKPARAPRKTSEPAASLDRLLGVDTFGGTGTHVTVFVQGNAHSLRLSVSRKEALAYGKALIAAAGSNKPASKRIKLV